MNSSFSLSESNETTSRCLPFEKVGVGVTRFVKCCDEPSRFNSSIALDVSLQRLCDGDTEREPIAGGGCS
jgi:hypothetical protein